MTALLKLAERCEQAIFPCLDDASAGEIVAIKSAICRLVAGRGYDAYSPDYTNSLDAAMTLVPKRHKWAVYGGGYATVAPWDGTEAEEEIDLDHTKAATPALALCAAALKARAAQADRNPEGHDPAEGHGRNDESPVAATGGDAPAPSSSPSPGGVE